MSTGNEATSLLPDVEKKLGELYVELQAILKNGIIAF